MTVEVQPQVAVFVAAAPDVSVERRVTILPRATAAASSLDGILVATCHRVEILLETSAAPAPSTLDETTGLRGLHGVDAASHVIRLALGLESAVVGEDQILHQIRSAVAEVRRRRSVTGDLGLLVDHALRAGRIGRSWRPRLETSLAGRAMAIAESVVGPLDGRQVLVVGAGQIGRLVADSASRRAAVVSVASRDPGRATELARVIGALAVPFDPGAERMSGFDVVIVALAGPWRVREATAEAIATRDLVIDLSNPPALPSGVRDGLGERAIDIDGLDRDVGSDPATTHYRARLERHAEATLAAYLEAVAGRGRPAADRLAERVERHRQEVMDAYLRHRPDLEPSRRTDLDELTRALSARLFREPLARLASDRDGGRERALDELFGP